MKGKLFFLLLLIIGSFSNACRKLVGEDDKLSLERKPYPGPELKIDGYYYMKYGNPEFVDIYFFYRNGIVLSGETPLTSELEVKEEDYRNGTYYNFAKGIKYYWGAFVVEGNSIKFERWYPSEPPLQAYLESGEIINDTTFHITKSIRSNGTNESSEDHLYHFKQFSPKPDSTNEFVE